MINIYHMFNIILPKPCEIFAKFLLKICQKFGKDFTMFFNKYNSGTFWQNDLFQGKLE